MRGQNGVTLIELMVALAIIAIIASVAAPSFQDMIRRNQLTTTSNEMLGVVQLARSEAIKRNRPVVLSLDAAATGSSPHLWAWVDDNGNGTYQGPGSATPDTLVRQYRMSGDGLTLRAIQSGSTGTTASFSFRPDGMTSAATQVSIRLCDSEDLGRFIRVLVSGSVRGGEDTSC